MNAYCCNVCRSGLEGIAYRTQCCHLLCPVCAQDNFSKQHMCPICGTQLRLEDVHEVAIGVRTNDATDQIFQIALSGGSLEDISKSVVQLLQALQEVSVFAFVQLGEQFRRIATEANNQEQRALQTDLQMAALSQDFDEQIFRLKQELSSSDQQLMSKNSEVMQLQESLKEKIRKCQAWEKAYGSIRAQLLARTGSSLHENLETPEATTQPQLHPGPPAPASQCSLRAGPGPSAAVMQVDSYRVHGVQGTLPTHMAATFRQGHPVATQSVHRQTLWGSKAESAVQAVAPYGSAARRLEMARAAPASLSSKSKPMSGFFDRA